MIIRILRNLISAIFVFFVIIGLVSLYRSYIAQVPFPEAFMSILSAFVEAAGPLFTIPTVFAVIAGVVVIIVLVEIYFNPS